MHISEDGNHVFIERSVNMSLLAWPSATELEGYNRIYVDLRGMSWRRVREAVEFEEQVLLRFGWNTNSAEEHLGEDGAFESLLGLDIGVASAVLALSAAKCAPISSCNGSTGHLDPYPLVAFFSRARRVPDLLEASEEAGCGLVNGASGYLLLYSSEIRDLLLFARALLHRRDSLSRLRSSPKRRMACQAGHQLRLDIGDETAV